MSISITPEVIIGGLSAIGGLAMVSGRRVIYNDKARFAGSPYHQGFNTPYGNLCHYKWTFPDDDKFLGATSFNKIHQHGNGAGDDGALQREQLANTFLRALGVPWLNRRSVIVYVNGNRRGQLMEDAQTPDDDVVEQYFRGDADGWLFKMQPWFEFGPYPSGTYIPFGNMSWVNMMPYTDGVGNKVRARYRYNFLSRQSPTYASDFSRVYSMVDAASTYGTSNYVANMEKLADMENWMRVFAANHAAGNWDAYGAQNAQNLYGYIGNKVTSTVTSEPRARGIPCSCSISTLSWIGGNRRNIGDKRRPPPYPPAKRKS